MRTRLFIAFLLVSSLTAGTASAQPVTGENVKIYAAAVVKTPRTAVAADYEKTTGNTVTLIFDTVAPRPKVSGGSPSGIADYDRVLIRDAKSTGQRPAAVAARPGHRGDGNARATATPWAS